MLDQWGRTEEKARCGGGRVTANVFGMLDQWGGTEEKARIGGGRVTGNVFEKARENCTSAEDLAIIGKMEGIHKEEEDVQHPMVRGCHIFAVRSFKHE